MAALGPFGPAPAQGAEAPPAAAETRATTLEAGQPHLLRLSLAPRAKLTDSVTGAPLAGQLVRLFRIPTHDPPLPNPTACYAYTDAAGVARCGGSALSVTSPSSPGDGAARGQVHASSRGVLGT